MPVKGYKGFNADMTCRDFKYEIGGTYESDDAIRCGNKGFHLCEDAIDVLAYYAPGTSRFCTVEGDGKIDQGGPDTKVACSRISIGAEISLADLITAGIKFRFDKVDWSKATESATGYRGAASATGDRGTASATGKHSVACGMGVECKAKAALGCGIVLVEREWSETEKAFVIKNIKAAKVDGKKIKADTWYKLEAGKFVEVE